jgi:hypothetical protein
MSEYDRPCNYCGNDFNTNGGDGFSYIQYTNMDKYDMHELCGECYRFLIKEELMIPCKDKEDRFTITEKLFENLIENTYYDISTCIEKIKGFQEKIQKYRNKINGKDEDEDEDDEDEDEDELQENESEDQIEK